MTREKSYEAIASALQQMALRKSTKSDGRVTGIRLALEAGVSKATLYRFLNRHIDLREAYEALSEKGVRGEDPPVKIKLATPLLKEEVNRLHSELAEIKRERDKEKKIMAHQIQLLWSDNERLRDQVQRLQNSRKGAGNVLKLSE